MHTQQILPKIDVDPIGRASGLWLGAVPGQFLWAICFMRFGGHSVRQKKKYTLSLYSVTLGYGLMRFNVSFHRDLFISHCAYSVRLLLKIHVSPRVRASWFMIGSVPHQLWSGVSCMNHGPFGDTEYYFSVINKLLVVAYVYNTCINCEVAPILFHFAGTKEK